MSLIPVLHNVYSVQKVLDFVKLCITSDIITLIVMSKVGGAAAQSGIPEAYKLIFKEGKNLLILNDVSDVVELLHTDKVYFITCSKDYEATLNDLVNDIVNGKKVIAVFNGSDVEFSRQELKYGLKTIIPEYNKPISSISQATIVLYEVTRALSKLKEERKS